MTTTSRVFSRNKVIAIPYTGVTATAVLADALGKVYQDISDVAWKRIVLENRLDTFTGSSSPSVTMSLITTNDQINPGATTDPAAKAANGSTTIALSAQTAAGRAVSGFGRTAADGSAASNVGKFLGVLATIANTVTACAGTIFIYLEGE